MGEPRGVGHRVYLPQPNPQSNTAKPLPAKPQDKNKARQQHKIVQDLTTQFENTEKKSAGLQNNIDAYDVTIQKTNADNVKLSDRESKVQAARAKLLQMTQNQPQNQAPSQIGPSRRGT